MLLDEWRQAEDQLRDKELQRRQALDTQAKQANKRREEEKGKQKLQRIEEALRSSYYTALGIEEDASATAVRAAGRRVSVECHPDKFPYCQQRATIVFQELQKALEVLQDPKARVAYNRSLKQQKEQSRASERQRPSAGGEFGSFRVVSLEQRYGCDPREVQREDEEIQAARWEAGIHACPKEGNVCTLILPGLELTRGRFLGTQIHLQSGGPHYASVVHVEGSSVALGVQVGTRVFRSEAEARMVKNAVLRRRGRN